MRSPPLSGAIGRNGTPARAIAYLPQAAEIDRSFPINVYDLVAMGLWRRVGLFGAIGRKDRGAVEAAIAAVGLTGFEARTIGSLSGGQMQRALFARLLLQDAGIILLDEPFTAIDTKTDRRPPRSGASAGTARRARSSPCCTTSRSCAAIFPNACSWHAKRSPGARRPRC